jgi:predicted ATP-grasp superfamily ATP-dependent carboligase
MTGQAVVPAIAPEGRKWMVEDVDLFSSLRYWRDGKFTARQWLSSFHGVRETAFFAVDDPLPLAGACMIDGKRALRQAFGASGTNPALNSQPAPAAGFTSPPAGTHR